MTNQAPRLEWRDIDAWVDFRHQPAGARCGNCLHLRDGVTLDARCDLGMLGHELLNVQAAGHRPCKRWAPDPAFLAVPDPIPDSRPDPNDTRWPQLVEVARRTGVPVADLRKTSRGTGRNVAGRRRAAARTYAAWVMLAAGSTVGDMARAFGLHRHSVHSLFYARRLEIVAQVLGRGMPLVLDRLPPAHRASWLRAMGPAHGGT